MATKQTARKVPTISTTVPEEVRVIAQEVYGSVAAAVRFSTTDKVCKLYQKTMGLKKD